MATARYIVGDTRKITAKMPDASVDLVLTSPPFLALRSYLPDDHPDKALEIGSEATPADFLDVLLDLTEEWARVLTPYGSIVVELGDTYAGSGGAGGDYNEGGLRDGQGKADGSTRRKRAHNMAQGYSGGAHGFDTKEPGFGYATGGRGWPLDKSLCGIPHLYHLSLAYGRNLLRPERLTDPWRIRNVIAWCRPNPPVGALGDKFRPGTSYVTVACKARDRWFDLDAVRQPVSENTHSGGNTAYADRDRVGSDRVQRTKVDSHPAGAPPLDWWQVPTEPYAGSHYATWPRKLLTRPILSMCPEKVCTTCGQPSRRIVGEAEYVPAETRFGVRKPRPTDGTGRNGDSGQYGVRSVDTLGWSSCGHDTWRTGIVLDPFAGSGTTLAVATGHGRDAIGVDIDARNAELALERVGPLFLTIEHP